MTTTSLLAPPRELPPHSVQVFSPRLHDFALVIPVLNEGERVRTQLKKLQAMQLPIDVIIADGNSTDGSTHNDFLRSVAVRAVLVNSGGGGLSAQLRMAYAWCLDEGYAGIITVDGNGKDGLEAILGFIKNLEEDFDYVQGSRYLRGGAAINTPISRYLAGRLIHAPLISVAAGHRFTDTTNGFRAYSRRSLEDPRVQPFRNVFVDYNLLFYLSARLPRLGFRTVEIPVTRMYPHRAAVPTKIDTLAKKVSLFYELLGAVMGRYKPK